MKRARSQKPVIMLLLLLSMLATGLTVSAQQPVAPTVDTTCSFGLKTGIPFAWLRSSPSSIASPSLTMTPAQTVQIQPPGTLAWDGSQWWVYVGPNFGNAIGLFWVELNSIEPRCATPTPPPPPTTTPAPGTDAANWQPGNVVRVRANVPFVWFRAAPAPGNPPIHTILPGTQLAITTGPIVDTFNQWWWQVRDTRNGTVGWVEQSLVELVTGPSPVTPAPSGAWQVGDTVRVKLSISFSWLRQAPSSVSGVLATARPGQYLLVQQGPVNDGVQDWWQVFIPSTNAVGWVEANSLEFVRR
jgi:hypothetical protein